MGTVYRYGDSVDDTAEKNFSVFSLTRMRSGKYMRVVKLCTNKVLVVIVLLCCCNEHCTCILAVTENSSNNNNNNTRIGMRTWGPKCTLATSGHCGLSISGTDRQVDGQTDSRPLLYAFRNANCSQCCLYDNCKSATRYTVKIYIKYIHTTTTTTVLRPLYRSTCVRILLVQSFTARISLLTATSAFGLRRRRWSSP